MRGAVSVHAAQLPEKMIAGFDRSKDTPLSTIDSLILLGFVR